MTLAIKIPIKYIILEEKKRREPMDFSKKYTETNKQKNNKSRTRMYPVDWIQLGNNNLLKEKVRKTVTGITFIERSSYYFKNLQIIYARQTNNFRKMLMRYKKKNKKHKYLLRKIENTFIANIHKRQNRPQ